jgi:hypothetical protein
MSQLFTQILLILLILIGVAIWANRYFRVKEKKKEDRELWKKNAQKVNDQLNDFLQKKKEEEYKSLLHAKISRYQPRLPHLIEGANEVMKWVRNDMETPSGPISIVRTVSELHDQAVVLTYHYMTQTKVGDDYTKGAGKVTRVWVYGRDGWKLVHEHISSG